MKSQCSAHGLTVISQSNLAPSDWLPANMVRERESCPKCVCTAGDGGCSRFTNNTTQVYFSSSYSRVAAAAEAASKICCLDGVLPQLSFPSFTSRSYQRRILANHQLSNAKTAIARRCILSCYFCNISVYSLYDQCFIPVFNTLSNVSFILCIVTKQSFLHSSHLTDKGSCLC